MQICPEISIFCTKRHPDGIKFYWNSGNAVTGRGLRMLSMRRGTRTSICPIQKKRHSAPVRVQGDGIIILSGAACGRHFRNKMYPLIELLGFFYCFNPFQKCRTIGTPYMWRAWLLFVNLCPVVYWHGTWRFPHRRIQLISSAVIAYSPSMS